MYGMAARLIETVPIGQRAQDALITSLRELRSAMNWLEDTSDFETAHQRLDGAGRLQRRHFADNCRLTFKDGGYVQECPVALAHNRTGLSVGAIVQESECSICSRDPDDCEHIAGRLYDGEVCATRITKFGVDHVAIVGRPNMPDARIGAISVDLEHIRAELGPAFEVGMDVLCDRCLEPCAGVVRPFETSGQSFRA